MCDIRRLCDVHTAIPFVNFRSKKQEYSNPSPSFFQRCNRDDARMGFAIQWDSINANLLRIAKKEAIMATSDFSRPPVALTLAGVHEQVNIPIK